MAAEPSEADTPAMLIRLIATPLWFLAAWNMTAMAAYVIGLPPVFAPICAVFAATAVWSGPAWLWWRSRLPQPVGPENMAQVGSGK